MAKNNHFSSSKSELGSLLAEQAAAGVTPYATQIFDFAASAAAMTGAVIVVSDLAMDKSTIFCGAFAHELGLENYINENSIWESRILDMMNASEQEAKFIAELRFFHYTRHHAKNRQRFYLMSKLRFSLPDSRDLNVLHRMYYVYTPDGNAVLYAFCIYEPLVVDFRGKSLVVDSATGHCFELDAGTDKHILSPRERQVLTLIQTGLKSTIIAERLNISPHTVNRHRQEILAKLQVKSSIEACRIATSMGII